MFNITNIFAFIVVAGLAAPFVKFEDEPVVQADVDPYLKGFDSTNMDQAEPEVQMYYYIKKYSKQYDIPTKYAFSVAYIESLYGGPCDKNYKHNVASYCGALGPMQIMPATAKLIYGKTVNKAQLKNDIDFLDLVVAWGVRTYDDCGWGTGDVKDVDLFKAIEDELTDAERRDLNKILAKKSITYKV